jgi:hypothetical protein
MAIALSGKSFLLQRKKGGATVPAAQQRRKALVEARAGR